ncbi:MAG: alpha-1,2-fucosyltransferase, partial [Planctomycetota bacterium]
VYREAHYHFDARVNSLRPPIQLTGYFQSPRYFEDQRDAIRTELTCPRPTSEKVLDLGDEIANQPSVSLHVRRGDYLTDANANKTFVSCPLSYYEHALRKMPIACPVFVFSDDITWCQTHLSHLPNVRFPDQSIRRNDLDDFWLMTQARHHVIANSSFSWWAAWWANHPDGITVAPTRWFVDTSRRDSDLIPESWIRV